jgi:hypothetical protein
LGMESKATDGIDGGFTKDDRFAGGHGGWERLSRNGKEAEVLLRPGTNLKQMKLPKPG